MYYKRVRPSLPVVIILAESCPQIGTLVEQAEARCHIRKKTCGHASHVKKKSCDRASVFSMFVVTRCSERHVRESSGGMESDLLPLSDVTVLAATSLKNITFF